MTSTFRSKGAPITVRARTAIGPRGFRVLALTAAIALAAPVTLAFANTVHTVAPGETASGIADHYNVPMQQIVDYNGISNVDFIVAGSKITIPSGGSTGGGGASASTGTSNMQYRVKAGDTLSWIAQNFGATVANIAAINDLDNENHIVEGQLLAVPATAVAQPTGLTQSSARQMLLDASVEFGIVPDLILALAWQESGWQQHLVSSAGAIGVMQVIPSTANWAINDLGVRNAEDWRTNPRSNIRVGAAVLSALIDQAGGNGNLGLAFYVQGWWSVEQYGFFDETDDYIASVNALRDWYR